MSRDTDLLIQEKLSSTGGVPTISARREESIQAVYDATSATSAATVVSAVTGKSIYITDVSISTDTAQSVKLQDDTGTPIVHVARKFLPANSVWSKRYITPIKVASGKALQVVCGGSSGNVTVDVQGYQI